MNKQERHKIELFSELKASRNGENFLEVWEPFLMKVGVKSGKKFLLSMNLLVVRGKAG